MTETLLICLFALPLTAALVGGLVGARLPQLTRALSVGSAVGVLLLALFLAQNVQEPLQVSFSWFQLGQLNLTLGILYTPLAAMMALVVGAVGVAVHLFSWRYMRDDDAQPRYWAGLSLFTAAMLGLTLCDNLALLFAFWEMVGFGSYLLIGHYSTPTANRAANKAFLINRLADVFFLLGIGLMFFHTGTLSLLQIPARFAELALPVQTTIAALILCGVVAKSAQLPLHVWLPDAMAGPTPVSALIHAATMVAAGVYLLCRLSTVFEPILNMVAWLGTFTALFAAIWAFGQTDLKRVLAYSTLSQLGFMVAGVGLGSPQAAFFHLTTHAFFKALLFLVAGAVIDACHHQQDALRMGGLWKKLPFTFAMFVLGSLALAGFPFTAGFFSKDTIFAAAQEAHSPIYYVLLVVSLMTALYMGRLAGLVFLGKPRSDEARHAHEGTWVYHLPLILLAVGAIAAGSMAFYPAFAVHAFAHLPHPHNADFLFAWGLGVSALGALLAWVYAHARREPLEHLGGLYFFTQIGFAFDRIWNALAALFTGFFARVFAFVDEVLVGGVLVNGVAASFGLAGFLAQVSYRRALTVTLYWILLGAALMMLLAYLP